MRFTTSLFLGSCSSLFFIFLLSEVFVDESKHGRRVLSLHGLLQEIHLIAYVITHLYGLVLVDFELFPASVLKNGSARLIRTFYLLAPLLMLFDLREKNQFLTSVAHDFDDLKKFLENVGARPDP